MKGLIDMANFVFKVTTTKKLKATGTLDLENMTIEINGEDKKLTTLLSEYDGCEVNLTVDVKSEEDLDMPEEDSEDDM